MDLAARLDEINHGVRAIADLRNEVRGLQTSIDELTARLNGILESRGAQIAGETVTESGPEVGSEIEIQQSENGITLIETEVVRLEVPELGTE